MWSPVRLLAIGVSVSLFTSAAAAQSAQKFSIQVSALGAKLSGDAYEGIGTGIGFEAQVRYNISAFSIGAGFQTTSHSLEDTDQKVHLSGGFVEPRYVIATKSNSVAPYISARFSVLRESANFDVQGNAAEVSASGVTLNGGGGLLFRLAERVNLDVGATWGYTNFGKGTAKLNGQEIPGLTGFEAGSGSNLVLRAGIALGIGK